MAEKKTYEVYVVHQDFYSIRVEAVSKESAKDIALSSLGDYEPYDGDVAEVRVYALNS